MQVDWKTGLAAGMFWLAVAAAGPAVEAGGMEPEPYTRAAIVFPANDSALRSNAGNLTVRGQIHPGLQGGHRVELLLDGVAWGEPRRTPEFALQNIDRGTHRLQIRIVDGEGKAVFAGAVSTVHLLRHSRLHSPRSR